MTLHTQYFLLALINEQFGYLCTLHFCGCFCRPETVAEAILELATDTSKVGQVMTVTNGKGRRYIHLLGDSKLWARQSFDSVCVHIIIVCYTVKACRWGLLSYKLKIPIDLDSLGLWSFLLNKFPQLLLDLSNTGFYFMSTIHVQRAL